MAADDRSTELATITALFLALSFFTVAFRCYVRIHMLKVFRAEDWLAIATLLVYTVYSIFVFMAIMYGAGKHVDDVPVADIPEALKMRWAGELSYIVTSLLVKFTIGVFLLRICSQQWQKITIWSTLVVCLAYSIFLWFVAAFQCQPIEYFWLQYTHTIKGRCLDGTFVTSVLYTTSAINAAVDWVLALLPIALVWNLDLGKRTKISIAGILALGSIASTATIVRIPYIWQLEHNTDFLYIFTDLAIWSTVELGLGLTASSIATLRPLFKSFLEAGSSRISKLTRRIASWPPEPRQSAQQSQPLGLNNLPPAPRRLGPAALHYYNHQRRRGLSDTFSYFNRHRRFGSGYAGNNNNQNNAYNLHGRSPSHQEQHQYARSLSHNLHPYEYHQSQHRRGISGDSYFRLGECKYNLYRDSPYYERRGGVALPSPSESAESASYWIK